MSTSGVVNADYLLNFMHSVEDPKLTVEKTGLLKYYPPSEPPSEPEPILRSHDTSYAEEYIRAEEEEIFKSHEAEEPSYLDDLEESSNQGDLPYLVDDRYLNLYHRFGLDQDFNFSPSLPITPYRNKILQMLDISNVLVIQGPTGTGKTTQVPQFILHDCAQRSRECNIIVTQPRKIAARSIARRVCQERSWNLGELVGYQVALDNRTSQDTCINFVTTGVFLRKIIKSKSLKPYTHIILDEVHERNADIDFALLIVRKYLRTNSKDVKVILMSATINSDLFSNYFSFNLAGYQKPASILEIGRNSLSVFQYHLNDLHSLGTVPDLQFEEAMISPHAYQLAYKLIRAFDKIEQVENQKNPNSMRGSVLVFLPGYFEIVEMNTLLHPEKTQNKWWILQMHSSITMDEQSRVFERPQPEYRKIILSTNICESSITVPDIKFVIDFCLTKMLVCDPSTNYPTLTTCWAPKANLIQRSGRAGRVSDGRCYRMITQQFYYMLPDYGIPEIQLAPLEKTVLMAKELSIGEPKGVLALAIEPPALDGIERAVLVLKEVGALKLTRNEEICYYDGDLTFMGRVMCSLPLDVHVSKLILYGYIFGCLEECVIIAASLSFKSFFSKPFQKYLEAYKSRLAWADGSFSDCMAFLNAYKTWQECKRNRLFTRPGGMSEQTWGINNFVEIKRIREVEKLVLELMERLKDHNIVPIRNEELDEGTTHHILQMMIAAAFYPNYFVKDPLDETVINREIGSKDPCRTVLLNGLPNNQGLLYCHPIQELLRCCSSKPIKIEFEGTKALVEFHKSADEQEGEKWVVPAIYLAVKMRRLRMALKIKTYPVEEGKEKLDQLLELMNVDKSGLVSNRITVSNVDRYLPPPALPAIDHNTVHLYVTAVITCGYFYARYLNDTTTEANLGLINHSIQSYISSGGMALKTPPLLGGMVLAPFPVADGKEEYFRARTEYCLPAGEVEVFFVDYGNTYVVGSYNLLMEMPKILYDIPPIAFPCQLSELEPSCLHWKRAEWSNEASLLFRQHVNEQDLIARIYSVVDGVVRLELYRTFENRSQISINDLLIKRGFAQRTEEALLSKKDHEARVQAENSGYCTHGYSDPAAYSVSQQDQQKLRFSTKPTQITHLHGPFSPLEISYRGLTKVAYFRKVKMEAESANSVSLDPAPQNSRVERLLVAANVGVSQDSRSINLSSTNLMPSVEGLASLLCLLFAPKSELRTDPKRTRYIGALCGLGFDPVTKQAIHPEHDIEIPFTVSITDNDIILINQIRMAINLVMDLTDANLADNPNFILRIQKQVRENLMVLLKSVRDPVEPMTFEHQLKWNQVREEHLLKTTLEGTQLDKPSSMPLIKSILLTSESWKISMRSHLEKLKESAGRSLASKMTKCQLCNEVSTTPRELLLHLESQQHRRRLLEYDMGEEE